MSFGWQANRSSIEFALTSIRQQIEDDVIDVEITSAAVHDGWARTARCFWDEIKYGPRRSNSPGEKDCFKRKSFKNEEGESATAH